MLEALPTDPTRLTALLIEADLALDGGSGLAGLAELARRLVQESAAQEQLGTAVATRFAPVVGELRDRLMEADSESGALVDELYENGVLDGVDVLATALGRARAHAGTPAAPGMVLVTVDYGLGAPVVLELQLEAGAGTARPRAREMVRAAMADFGVPPVAAVPTTSVSLPAGLDDPTVLLAECAALLSAATGLALPDGVVAMGAWAGSGFAVPTAAQVEGRLAAVRDDGRCAALLVPTDAGWSLRSAASGADLRSVADPGRGLRAVAELLFGPAWSAWMRDRWNDVLAAAPWSVADLSPRDDPLPEIDTHQIQTVFTALWKRKAPVVIVGGGATSGKRVIATRVVTRLTALKWQCVALAASPDTQALSTRDELVEAARAAFALDPGPARRQRLLVLSGMRAFSGGEVGDVLSDVSRRLGVSILALLRYESNPDADWETRGFTVVPAIMGPEQTRVFARKLAEQLTAELGALSAEEIDRIATENVANVAEMCRQLRLAAMGERFVAPDDEAALSGITPAERDSVAAAAASALIGQPVPGEDLAGVDADLLTELGFEPSVRRGELRIRSNRRCEEILLAWAKITRASWRDGSRDQVVDEALVSLIGRRMTAAAAAGRSVDLYGAVNALRGRDVRVARRAVTEFIQSPEYYEWRQSMDAVGLAWLLRSARSLLAEEEDVLCARFAAQVPDLPHDLARSELVLVADILRRHRGSIPDDPFDRCMDWLTDAVSRALDLGIVRRFDSTQLLRLLERFQHPPLDELIANRAGELLVGLDPTSLLDCQLVFQIDALVEHASRSTALDVRAPLADHPGVRRMLAHTPASGNGFAQVLMHLTLRTHFDSLDWDETIPPLQRTLMDGLPNSTVADIALALSQAGQFKVAFANRVLRYLPGFGTAVAALLTDNGSPTDAANLLNLVRRLHLQRAHEMLYLPDRSPNRELADKLAELLVDLDDGKGTGYLLAALTSIDETYQGAEEGVGTLMAEQLGLDWVATMLRGDPRPSTKFYLLRGVWVAHASFRDNLVELAVATVTNAVNSSASPWGAQLALTLAEDPEFGAEFALQLQHRLRRERVFDGMLGLQSPQAQAQVHYHRLARALFPDLASRYAREFDRSLLARNLVNDSMSEMAQATAAAVETMRSAGIPHPGPAVLREVFGDTETVATRLARLRSGGELATALRTIVDIDRNAAAAGVRLMLDTEEPDHFGELVTVPLQSELDLRVRRAMYTHVGVATDLLTAAERAETGAGKRLVSDAREHPWWIFTMEVNHLQEPGEQYRIMKGLAELGVVPGHEWGRWGETVHTRWKGLVHEVLSPYQVACLLRMFLIWNRPMWTDEIGRNVNFDGLMRRLSRGRPVDLAAAPRLVETLILAQRDVEARKITELLLSPEIADLDTRIGLYDLLRLYECAGRLGVDRDTWLAQALVARLVATLGQTIVYDEARHWSAAAWTACRLRDDGYELPDLGDVAMSPNLGQPYLVGQLLTALPRSPKVDEEVERVRQLTRDRVPTTTSEWFGALLIGARLDALPEFVDVDDPAAAAALERLSFRQIYALQGVAEQSPPIQDLLLAEEPEIKIRARRTLSFIDPFADLVVKRFR